MNKKIGASWHELFMTVVSSVWWFGGVYLLWFGGLSTGEGVYSFGAALMVFFGIPLFVVLYVREITRYVKHLWYRDEA